MHNSKNARNYLQQCHCDIHKSLLGGPGWPKASLAPQISAWGWGMAPPWIHPCTAGPSRDGSVLKTKLLNS